MESKPIKRNKKQLNINISPYLYRKMEELIEETKEFSGYSDIGELAIAQFIERYAPPKSKVAGIGNAPTGPRTEIMDLFSMNPEKQFA